MRPFSYEQPNTPAAAFLAAADAGSACAQEVAFLAGGNVASRTEDLQWTLLNSLEFLFD